MSNLLMKLRLSVSVFMLVVTAVAAGCSSKTSPESDATKTKSIAAENADATDSTSSFQPQPYEANAEQLLAARLDETEVSAGWIRLFDGHTLFGWEIAGNANWRIEDETITVDQGKPSLLCTSVPWQDYELTLEFNADEKTNSGVFLRTPLEIDDPATDCYEVNIAPDDNPYPTAGIVKRQEVSADAPEQTFGEWRTMHIELIGDKLKISVDGKLACEYTDPAPLAAGRIALQHNHGRVAFRNIRLRPLGLQSLLDKDLSQWKKYPEMEAEYTVNDAGVMQVKGGKGQIETKQSYDDFVLLAEYKLPKPEINSGIFFRCIPGLEMMGYECQLSNEMKDGLPLSPADCGTGGIFRRQDARVIAGETGKWATVLLVAHDDKMAAWVNGVQVSNWQDDREPHENPRKGKRLEAGTIMIQGHDPSTEAELKQFKIASYGE
ncbi:DUF1080 domain-containing protein [Novipirellula caenicola]|uniref:3-keto-alpha-glucoside-1,2-lyase/3-keto-2-hydroxy-glucal hydratase domain-containing protein n=1 Tax=Novipirellula caenicola TaxID=1536901 RepID=A0ABP9VMK1_9BACT